MSIRFSFPTWIALSWAAAIILALVLNVPFGIPNQWVWERRLDTSFEPTWVLASIVVLLAACLLAYLTKGSLLSDSKKTAAILFALFVLAIFFRFFVSVLLPQSSRPVPAFWSLVIISPVATSFYDEGRNLEQQGLSEYLRHYHEQLQSKPFHAATHPPGLPMLFWFWRRVAMTPTMQKLVPLDEVSLKVIRKIYIHIAPPLRPNRVYPSDADLKASWWVAFFCFLCSIAAMLIWAWTAWQLKPNPAVVPLIATTPSTLWWQTTVDSIHLLFVTLTFTSAFFWMKRRKMLGAVLTGLWAGWALWLAFKNAVPLLCIALWLLWESAKKGNRLTLTQLFVSLLLVFSPYLFAWLLFGFQPLETFKAASAAHHAQAGAHARSYLPWVFVNFADFAMGLGGAWFGLLPICLWNWHKEQFRPSLTVATLLILTALDFSGMVRGEVTRIWMPFIPLLTFDAIKSLPQSQRDVTLMAFIQGSTAIALQIHFEFLRPF